MLMRDTTPIAISLQFSYLKAGYNQWEDGSGQRKELSSMSETYLKRCNNFINRGIDEISSGVLDDDIKQEIKDQWGYRRVSKELLESVKEDMVVLLKDKQEQIREFY